MHARDLPASAGLFSLLDDWRTLLSRWARTGALEQAAQQALLLPVVPQALAELSSRLEAADFSDLPPVQLWPASSMAGAAGAYARSTGMIYLNQEWLASASRDQVLAVLTEELGHHLDALLNSSDTPGDEGELFAALLSEAGPLSDERRQRLLADNDQGLIWLKGRELAVERAAQLLSTPIRPASPGRSSGEFRNQGTFAALKADGSVVSFGPLGHSYNTSVVAGQLSSWVSQIFSTADAFAALKADGSVVTWGDDFYGGDSSTVASQLRSGVSQIFSTEQAFAALKADGSVVSWGAPAYTSSNAGGDSSAVASQLSSGVSQIVSTASAFAALKQDGSVVTWGAENSGGDSSLVASQLRSGVSQIFATRGAFAALKIDGSVVTWGSYYNGGDSSLVANQLSSGVSQIFPSDDAFAALKADGSVVTWGSNFSGGNSSAVASQLSSGVQQIFSAAGAFAALKGDGSVVTWGNSYYFYINNGGDSSAVADQLSSGVSQIFATRDAFAALKADGSVVTWGGSAGDSSAVASQLRSGVQQIFSTNDAFAALKSDGSVVTWGSIFYGGDSSLVASRLTSGVSQIFSTGTAFAALKSDGSVVTWGQGFYGDDIIPEAGQLNNVVAFANPLTDDRLINVGYIPGPTTINGVNLGSTILGYAVRPGDAPPLQVSFSDGIASPTNPGLSWRAMAAAPTSTGFAFYWYNPSNNTTVRWNLNADGNYESGYFLSGSLLLNEEAALGFDLNADGYTPGPTTINGVNLGQTKKGYALKRGDGAPFQAVKFVGFMTQQTNPGPGWDPVAATPSDQGISLFWRHSASKQVEQWNLDAGGFYLSSASLSPAEITTAEAKLNLDLNGDGVVAVSLVDLGRYALLSAGQPPIPIKYLSYDLSPDWPGWGLGYRPTGVTASASGYNLYLNNLNSQQTLRWQLDTAGSYVWGGEIASLDLMGDEASRNLDLNGDGFVSGRSTIKGLNLGSTAQGYALRTGDGPPIPVTWTGGNASANNPGNGWLATAAIPSGDGTSLYWQNSASGQWARWQLDASGAYQSGLFLSGDQFYNEEATLHADFNRDGITGAVLTSLDFRGNASLLSRTDGQAFVETNGNRYRVRSPFNLGIVDPSGEWQMLAAETVGDQNQILWRNNHGNFLHVWNLDDSWTWQSSDGAFSPISPEGSTLLAQFGLV